MLAAPLGPGSPQSVMVESRRERVGVGLWVDRPVLGRAAWGDTIQGDTIQSDCHPRWEAELWPNAFGLSLETYTSS